MVTWTADHIRRLKELWGEGLSAAQIAKAMGGGLSRNSIIGKSHRLGLKRGVIKPGKKEVDKSVHKAATPRPKKVNPNWVERAPLVPSHIPEPVGPSGGVSLAEKPFDSCPAIIGVLALPNESTEPAYCGAPKIEGKSWCGHHYAMFVSPPRAR